MLPGKKTGRPPNKIFNGLRAQFTGSNINRRAAVMFHTDECVDMQHNIMLLIFIHRQVVYI